MPAIRSRAPSPVEAAAPHTCSCTCKQVRARTPASAELQPTDQPTVDTHAAAPIEPQSPKEVVVNDTIYSLRYSSGKGFIAPNRPASVMPASRSPPMTHLLLPTIRTTDLGPRMPSRCSVIASTPSPAERISTLSSGSHASSGLWRSARDLSNTSTPHTSPGAEAVIMAPWQATCSPHTHFRSVPHSDRHQTLSYEEYCRSISRSDHDEYASRGRRAQGMTVPSPAISRSASPLSRRLSRLSVSPYAIPGQAHAHATHRHVSHEMQTSDEKRIVVIEPRVVIAGHR